MICENFCEVLAAEEEVRHDAGVEVFRLGTSIATDDDFHSPSMIDGVFVGPLATQGVIDVTNLHEARGKRDCLALESMWITAAIPSLMVVKGDLRTHASVGRMTVGKNTGAQRRMAFHDGPFFG